MAHCRLYYGWDAIPVIGLQLFMTSIIPHDSVCYEEEIVPDRKTCALYLNKAYSVKEKDLKKKDI